MTTTTGGAAEKHGLPVGFEMVNCSRARSTIRPYWAERIRPRTPAQNPPWISEKPHFSEGQ